MCSHKKWNRSFPHETPVTFIYCGKINYKDKLCYPFTSCVNFIYQVLNFPHCRYGKIPVIHYLIIWKSSQSSTWGQWSRELEFCVLPKKEKKFNQRNRQISRTISKRPPKVHVHEWLWYILTQCLLPHQLLSL